MQATLTPATHGREMVSRLNVAPLPSVSPDHSRVAVLLNRNARRVSDKLARELESIVGPGNLFYSRSLEDAESFAREIVQRGYGTVACGGGDGTLTRAVNLIQRYVNEANTWRLERYRRYGEWQTLLQSPRFALLRLGTGNGLAPVVGAGDPVADLTHIVGSVPTRHRALPMIDVGGERCFFTGLGYDSLLLNDYNWLKGHLRSRLLKPLSTGVVGYFAAALSRTLPNVAFRGAGRLEARVVTRAPAYYVDPRSGDALEELEPGTVLFEGPASMIGAGTTPYYGYGFKMYPFSQLMPGMLNLRIAHLGPMAAVAHLRSIWKGSYRDANRIFDFLATDVDVELEQPFPFQHSGDAQGMRKNLRWHVAEDRLHLLDMHRPRRVLS
jgi:diacylglycerol kinase family enzyme